MIGRHRLRTHGSTSGRLLGLWSPVPFDKVEIRETETTPTDEFFGPMFVGLRVLESRRRLTSGTLGESSVAGEATRAVVGAPAAGSSVANSGLAFLFLRDAGGADVWGQVETFEASDASAGAQYGSAVAIQGDLLVVGASGDSENGSGSGAVYIYQRDLGGPGVWGEVAKILASDGAAGDEFGAAVGISGNWVMVGAPGADAAGVDSGALYAFGRNTGGADNWGQVHKITGSDTAAGDDFGRSLAIEGDVMIVGAPLNLEPGFGPFTYSGAAFVFGARIGGPGVWGEAQKLLPNGRSEILGYGQAVALSGSRALVSAPQSNTQTEVDFQIGSVYVLEKDAQGVWALQRRLDGTFSGEMFGESVALDGDIAVIRAGGGGSLAADGEIYFYEYDPTNLISWRAVRFFGLHERSTSVAAAGGNIFVGTQDDALAFLPFLFRDGFESGKLSRWGQK